jgi:hypothetical protein
MKVQVTLKDPDALIDAVNDAVRADVAKLEGLTDAEREAVFEVRSDKAHRDVGKWFAHGEYLTVEVDTEANTATVVKP